MKKKLLLFISALALTGLVRAQDSDCMAFFPENPGAILISKSYDAKKNLQYTTTYKVLTANDNYDGADSGIVFVITDSKGKAIDQGNIETECDEGVFFLKMVNRAMSPDIMGYLGQDTDLVGEFLDYPNTFADTPYEGDFQMDGGEYTVQSKEDKSERLRVRVYNREYEKNEKVTTPAGTFDAAKISFYFDVYKDKTTVTYKGIEWYALRAGIVRSETYKGDQLQSYTELTTLKR